MALDYQLIERESLNILTKADEPLLLVCNYLKQEIPHFDWVGFYFMNPEKKQLEVGPYAGDRTPHTSIPFGKGICGQVAVSGETFLSQDVSQEENYLACSIDTKAELVVPIFRDEMMIGQIDVDSHQKKSFTKADELLLKSIGAAVANLSDLPI